MDVAYGRSGAAFSARDGKTAHLQWQQARGARETIVTKSGVADLVTVVSAAGVGAGEMGGDGSMRQVLALPVRFQLFDQRSFKDGLYTGQRMTP